MQAIRRVLCSSLAVLGREFVSRCYLLTFLAGCWRCRPWEGRGCRAGRLFEVGMVLFAGGVSLWGSLWGFLFSTMGRGSNIKEKKSAQR